MEWNNLESPRDLEVQLIERDYDSAGNLLEALCQDLETYAYKIDAKIAKKVLALLKKYAWFDKLHLMAKKFDENAQDDFAVRKELAQAEIELGQYSLAIKRLMEMKSEIETVIEEHSDDPPKREQNEYFLGETYGLLGRAHKQLYINANPLKDVPRVFDFEKAYEYYHTAFTERFGLYLWHGINCVALLNHKEKTHKRNKKVLSKEGDKIARSILETLELRENQTGRLAAWDHAIRMEAYLAIGNTKQALRAAGIYLDMTNAFEVQSTRRQLIELWKLSPEMPPGDSLLPMMDARMVELGDLPQSIQLDPSHVQSFEKVWGDTKYKPLKFLRLALEASQSVVKFGPGKFSEGAGTGFVFKGEWIDEAWKGKPLILTNAHVCSNDNEVINTYPFSNHPDDLKVMFFESANGRSTNGNSDDIIEYPIKEVVWTSPPYELDATLVLLDKDFPEEHKNITLNKKWPLKQSLEDSRLNILGHPKGLDMKVSFQDNKMTDEGEKYVYYKTPTDKGSSGSPVFNNNWQLVALHHSSKRAKKANEGIRIDVIIEALKSALLNDV